jgi:hypothetical protein
MPLAANFSEGKPGKPGVENGRCRPKARSTNNARSTAPAAPMTIAARAMDGRDVRMKTAVARTANQPIALASGALTGALVIVENS